MRFSFADYDPAKLKNRYAHLTNNSVSKHARQFEDRKDETMWHSDSFREYVAGLGMKDENGDAMEDPWTSHIQPKMKETVLRSLESVQDVVQASSDLSSWHSQ